jgi:hypothetical protein
LTLVFDPAEIEGSWEAARPGQVAGVSAVLAAALSRSVLADPTDPDVVAGVHAGLTAARVLHRDGFGQPGAPVEAVEVAFPLDRVAAAIVAPDPGFAALSVPGPIHRRDDDAAPGTDPAWTILRDRHPEQLGVLARRIVERGPSAVLRDVPVGRFGPLVTVDRDEIEALRSVRSLIAEYVAQDHPARPLSIAVFGAPGAGKSFAVTAVAGTLLPGRLAKIECNLSQLEDPTEIDDVLHRARDAGLRGDLPLVFWDEFDTPLGGRPLGWLRHFLAPMQDGEFRQGQVVHPIGRAVFVFAGGTAHRLAEFGARLDESDFVGAKGPDFVSRLRGNLDIAGPNPRFGSDGTADPYSVVRRAVLLHSLLRRKAPGLIHTDAEGERVDIDPGVLRAMLEVSAYRHGARSMEAILDMSQLAGHAAFERSSLPSEAQLDLHVNGREFLSILQRLELTGELLERLAEAAHDVFCAGLRERGYTFGPVSDESLRVSSTLRPYAELDVEFKEQNRANVRDIADKLALAGYVMVPARGSEDGVALPAAVIEELAEREHERWMEAKLAAGWEHGEPTDPRARRHEALVPWSELPESQRVKDRDMVVGIPLILERAGYTIVPAGD